MKSKNIDDEEKLEAIKVKNAECDIKYHISNLYGGYINRTIVIKYFDKGGVAHLTNGKVLPPDESVVSEEIYDKIQLREKYKNVSHLKWLVESFVKDAKSYLSNLQKNEPFSNARFSIDIDYLERRFYELPSINIEKGC